MEGDADLGLGSAAWFSRRVVEGDRPGYIERTDDRINDYDSGWRSMPVTSPRPTWTPARTV